MQDLLKTAFDFTVAFVAVVVLSPLFIVLILLLLLSNRGKVFFTQKRVGKNNAVFTVLKFRTMNDRRDEKGELLPDAERLTSVGKFIRRTSLDELPQLFNVLRGEMSLVGPRPLLVEYLPLYSPEQARRHAVKPGITGWAQINGRNALSWAEKFKLDVWYVEHRSFLLDLKIILITTVKVIRSQGISAAGQSTMPQFTGKN